MKNLLLIIIMLLLQEGMAQNNSRTMRGDKSALKAPIRYLEVNGAMLAYKIIGEGEPVLFLQRFRGNLNDWDPAFVDAMARQYKVILFDLPGIGSSSGKTPSSLTQMSEDALAFATQLGLSKATVLGWSMGGMVAQILTINHPEFVSKLVLLGTTPAGNPEVVFASKEFSARSTKPENDFEDHVFLFFHDSPNSRAAAQAYWERCLQYGISDKVTAAESWQEQGVAIRAFYQNKEKNYFELLRTIKVPTLIANGKYDPVFPMVNSYVLAREIKDSKLIIYPDAGHGFQFQYHQEFVPEIFAFLKR